jgi:predicted transcriptional regulator of viral defense system
MPTLPASQREQALALLEAKGMVRLAEFAALGITAATISRLEKAGEIMRLARGLYQLADADLDLNHSLAEAAKLVPRGVVCLNSALAFYDLTDHIPAKVWVAIRPTEWKPTFSYPPARFVRFSEAHMSNGIEIHKIESVDVPITSVVRTVVDLFRYRNTVGLNIALEGLRNTLRQRIATPADIANQAVEMRMWNVMEPYMSAMTSDA